MWGYISYFMAQPIVGVNNQSGVIGEGSDVDLGAILPVIVEKFIQVVEAVLILVVAVFVIRMVRRKLRAVEMAHEHQRNAVNLMEKIISGFIIVVSVTLALKTVGIDMTLLVSVAILGLSYGLQDIIKNYVAGILILFKAPFKIGDIVKIRDFTGKVNKMDFQSTSLETFDNRHITIYNSDVMTQSIVNYSKNDMRRLEMNVSLGYGTDIKRALKVFEKILSDSPVLKKPHYSVVFRSFGESGVGFTLKFWVQMPCNILKTRTDIATRIMQAFDDKVMFMPYTKGVEVESEAVLGGFGEERTQRVQAYFQLPLFADLASAVVSAVEGPVVQPVVETATGIGVDGVVTGEGGVAPTQGPPSVSQIYQDYPDFDEPE